MPCSFLSHAIYLRRREENETTQRESTQRYLIVEIIVVTSVVEQSAKDGSRPICGARDAGKMMEKQPLAPG